MSFHRQKVDFMFTNNGDLVFDDVREDIADTNKIPLKALQQQIDARINSNKNDWLLNPDLGADLKRYLGEPNNRDTGNRIKLALENELARGGFLKNSEFSVTVFPISGEEIAIYLGIKPIGEQKKYQQIYTYNLKNPKMVRSK